MALYRVTVRAASGRPGSRARASLHESLVARLHHLVEAGLTEARLLAVGGDLVDALSGLDAVEGAATRLNPVEVAIDVELEQDRRMIGEGQAFDLLPVNQ